MTKLIDALFARTNFGAIMKEAEKKESRFLVSCRGKPKVIILSVEDYMRNIIKKPKILAEIQQGAFITGLDKMTEQEIQNEIDGYRKTKK